jgi:hypothetical protein
MVFLFHLLNFFLTTQELEYFFFLHQNQNMFSSNIGNQNIFLEKNHNPPFKLNGRSLSSFVFIRGFRFQQLRGVIPSFNLTVKGWKLRFILH